MDRHARFLALFLEHQGDVRAFIRAVVREPAARDDVLQEVALVLWRELDRYDEARPFGAWARGVTAKVLLKRWERRKREEIVFSPEAIAALVDVAERLPATPGASRRQHALQGCLGKLPEKSRRLVGLRYEEGLTLAEVAARVASTVDAVHKALSRIREKLEACIERELRAPERPGPDPLGGRARA